MCIHRVYVHSKSLIINCLHSVNCLDPFRIYYLLKVNASIHDLGHPENLLVFVNVKTTRLRRLNIVTETFKNVYNVYRQRCPCRDQSLQGRDKQGVFSSLISEYEKDRYTTLIQRNEQITLSCLFIYFRLLEDDDFPKGYDYFFYYFTFSLLTPK